MPDKTNPTEKPLPRPTMTATSSFFLRTDRTPEPLNRPTLNARFGARPMVPSRENLNAACMVLVLLLVLGGLLTAMDLKYFDLLAQW